MGDLSMTPDLRELLGEIADDPRAQLLRVKTAQAAREGLERNPKVSSSAPFLRKAERRLLELHREELGRLLYAYAHIARMEVPENSLRVHYQDLKVPTRTKDEIDHRARALLKAGGAEDSEANLLRRCLATTRDLRPTEIVGAALRVAPADKVQAGMAADLCLEGMLSEANGMLSSFLGRGASSGIDSYAWESKGFLAARAGMFVEAAACYETTVRIDATRVVPALGWLRFSLLAERKDLALRAGAFIDCAVPSRSLALPWYRQLAEMGAGIVSSPTQWRMARSVADQCGPVTREVIDGFQ